MARGYDGWLAIYEDDRHYGTVFSNPQPLFLDSESLDIKRDVRRRQPQMGMTRLPGTSLQLGLATKPAGGFSYSFRSDDCLKVLYSHFQNGSTSDGTTYTFSAKGSNLDYSVSRPLYTVSAKKRLSQWGTGYTNYVFFKHGVCESLSFGIDSQSEAQLSPSFRFTSYTIGETAENPGTAFGTYSPLSPFHPWVGTIYLDGTRCDYLTAVQFTSSQEIQEVTHVGTLSPDLFKTTGYKVTGSLKFDIPKGGLAHLGSMISMSNFQISGTLFNSATDFFTFNMPACRRIPFEVHNPKGRDTLSATVPFEAFSPATGTAPLTITVKTAYDFAASFYTTMALENDDDLALDNDDDLELT